MEEKVFKKSEKGLKKLKKKNLSFHSFRKIYMPSDGPQKTTHWKSEGVSNRPTNGPTGVGVSDALCI